MLYSCKKCLKSFNKEINKCPICGGEVKQTLNEEYIKEGKINYRCPHCNHNFDFDFDICPSCGKHIPRDINVIIPHTEEHIIEEIKKSHPNWTEKNGLCPKCYAHYKKEIHPD